MLRGPLGEPDAITRFSGHETFPLRRLWLRKAYWAVRDADSTKTAKSVFDKDDGLIRFGVGKNMVWAIRHWAQVCRIIEETEKQGRYRVTPLGDLLFHPKRGVDPYMESVGSTWLLHWLIASNPSQATTWYYAFNHLNIGRFDREALAAPLRDLCIRLQRSRSSSATIKRDVECFVRSYVPPSGSATVEDEIESVLGEIGILKEVSSRSFEFQRGPKPTLPDGVFLFALDEFWRERTIRRGVELAGLSVEEIAYEPGSPGRIFKMDEESIVDRLVSIEDLSSGAFRWSDSAGVRVVARLNSGVQPLDFIRAGLHLAPREVAA